MIDRRTFTRAVGLGAGTTALSLAALPPAAGAAGVAGVAAPAGPAGSPVPGRTGFSRLARVRAGVLDVGYAEDGPADGPAVICLHGWPYDIHS
ncbi:hypothetical protein [Kitasatospora sp. NPDC056273]|uniref:hypothetical protein n=1 Tax=Kitasatospora sp. NPDC056273 TaxID=3345769 RepID=UPI0035D76932